jgi:hypothetical protein
MKKSTGTKSKPKFAKKRANSKPDTKKAVHPATDMPQTQPSDAPPEVKIGGPTPEVRPCSPAETQKGHHEVIQS